LSQKQFLRHGKDVYWAKKFVPFWNFQERWKIFLTKETAGEVYAFLFVMKAAIFLERDGILNLARTEQNQQMPALTFNEFQLNKEALAPLLELKAAGFLLIATTNQPAMSEGEISRWDLDRMHDLLRRSFALDDILICPHAEDEFCPCRKPKSGLFSEAAFTWHIDLERSYVISDKWQDAEAARVIGATSLLMKSPWIGEGHHDFVLPDVASIVKKIRQLESSGRVLAA
jgi:D-glycero-D-manno-heptose 1,7-bisphosphate phosphatase